jgi:molecular chaperone DnaJ
VLSDPAKRASYDAHGFAGLAGVSAEDLWGGLDLADILGPGMPGFGGLFDRLFGQTAPGPPRGADLRADLVIPLRRVLTGGKQTVTITRPGPCSQCAAAEPVPVPLRVPARTAAGPASAARPAAAAQW